MESIKAERQPDMSAEDFIKLTSDVLLSEHEILTVAFAEVRDSYGESFGNHTLEGLFSSDNFTRFFSDENIADKEWIARQIREISLLCNELTTATDSESKKQISRELVDYLVNI